jgi:hypothetical protein
VYSAPVPMSTVIRGLSSVGRALAWHARSQEFESPRLHLVDFIVGLVGPLLSGNELVDLLLAQVLLLLVVDSQAIMCCARCEDRGDESRIYLLLRDAPGGRHLHVGQGQDAARPNKDTDPHTI